MQSALNQIATRVGLSVNLVMAALVVAGILLCGSAVRWIGVRNAPAAERRTRMGSLLVWWGMLAVVTIMLIGGRIGGAITFGTISLIALNEYFRMLDKKFSERRGRLCVYLAVPATYGGILLHDGLTVQIVMLLVVTGMISVRLVLGGITSGFLVAASSLTWGTLVFVFCLSHAVMLLGLPDRSNPVAGPAGWLVYLIVFTQCDDIFQALWGRRFGRRRIAPSISPHKTWEGFLLGGMTAVLIGIPLAPLLTPLAEPWTIQLGTFAFQAPYVGVLLAGGLLALAGFFGDLNISAVKRDVGVKDSGNWLPGQGGMLDRIDSLTFTAPVFYYFVRFFYG